MVIDATEILKRIKKNEQLVKDVTISIHVDGASIPDHLKNDLAHLCQIVNTYNKMFKEIYREYDTERAIDQAEQYKGFPELH